MSTVFKGYCFDKFGKYTSPVTLSTVEEVFNYCELQKHFQHEIRIVTPSDDAIVVHVKSGRYIYPDEWMVFNCQS